MAGCYAGPGTRPVAEVEALQCDRVKARGSVIAVGEAFVDAVERGDEEQASTFASRVQGLWREGGSPFEPEGTDGLADYRDRQRAIGGALPRFEWFVAVMNASPLEVAARGTAAMLPEMRSLLEAIGLSECAVIELPPDE